MSANDGDDYIRVETDWVKVPLRERRRCWGSALAPR